MKDVQKRPQRHLYGAKNDFYRQNAFYFIFFFEGKLIKLYFVYNQIAGCEQPKGQARSRKKRSRDHEILKFEIENFEIAKSFFVSLQVE